MTERGRTDGGTGRPRPSQSLHGAAPLPGLPTRPHPRLGSTVVGCDRPSLRVRSLRDGGAVGIGERLRNLAAIRPGVKLSLAVPDLFDGLLVVHADTIRRVNTRVNTHSHSEVS